jgi:PAS domain S-box-containing protein
MKNNQSLINSLFDVMLENSEDFIAVIDEHGNAKYFNSMAKRITGIDPEKITATANIWENLFVDKVTGLKLLNICRNLIKNQRSLTIQRLEIFDQNRQSTTLSCQFKTIKTEHNQPGALISGKLTGQSTADGSINPDHKYLDIFQSAPIGFFRSLPEGRFLEANQSFAAMLGFNSPFDLIKTVTNIGNQVYFEPSFRNEIVSKAIMSKQLTTAETIFKTVSGKPVNVRINVNAKYDDEIQTTVLEGTVENISERKLDQEALKRSEHEMTSLFTAMDDLVFIFGSDGKYEYVAPTNPDLLVASSVELTGKYVKDFMPAEIADNMLAKIRECLKSNQTEDMIYPLSIREKNYWFEVKFSPLTPQSVIAVARDITDRVTKHQVMEIMLNIARAVGISDEINQLFELIRKEISKLIDTKNFFIALYDAEENALHLPYFKDEKDSFEYFPAEKTLSALVLKQKKSKLLRAGDIQKLAGKGIIKVVGSPAKVWLGIPLMAEGEVLGLLVVQDYDNENAISTEHRQLLEMISPQISLSIFRKQAETALQESNQTKDRFFNIIAHDLKNPFNAIIGFTSLLIDEWNEFEDDDKISMISSIKSSSEGAFELLMNLLEWSRLHVGKISFEPEFIDYNSLVKINFSLLRANAENKNIRLQVFGDCNKMVWADPNMIKTVIRNLITNAIKFTSENGTIRVDCSKNPDYPGMMILSIKDTGVGMTKEEIATIFNLNHSSSTTGTQGETGTGLGLLLCKEFIEKNNGKIWIESELNVGSTFYIALPTIPKI